MAVSIFTETAFPKAPFRVIVNLIAPPSLASPPEIEKLGGSSSSLIVISSPVIVSGVPDDPLTLTVSSDSSSKSLSGVRVKLPLPLAAPAAMVMSKSATFA